MTYFTYVTKSTISVKLGSTMSYIIAYITEIMNLRAVQLISKKI